MIRVCLMNETILVVDDEFSIRDIMQSFLSRNGFRVFSAKNYDESIQLINETDFDLIFVDINLGEKSGMDVLREARSLQPHCPVVMVTGYPDIDTSSESVRLGAFDYIRKPIKLKELLNVARRGLKQKMLLDDRKKYRLNMEAIFRSVKDVIITVDSSFSIIQVSESAGRICGFTRDLVGKNFRDLPEECNGRCYQSVRETIETGRDIVVDALKCGNPSSKADCVSMVTSPLKDARGKVSGAVMVVRDETRLDHLERDLRRRRKFYSMVGKSEKMQAVYTLIENVADYGNTVLITGESGTGKELVCEALFHRRQEKNGALVRVNCSALSEALIENELFGHVKGAFTGADTDRIGRFELADEGMIFLDEIGDISLQTQVKLLRVLERKEFEKVGDPHPVRVNTRVVAATSRNLEDMVKAGKFREALYYRLKVIEICLPPLRERMEDLPLLVDHFLEHFSLEFGKEILNISREVMNLFMAIAWPGNIRELEHILEHACLVAARPVIDISDLPRDFVKRFSNIPSVPAGRPEHHDKKVLLKALEKSRWNKTRAAQLLGISRRTLYRKIGEYDINTS